jgi:iron complex outermembrane receptor protein
MAFTCLKQSDGVKPTPPFRTFRVLAPCAIALALALMASGSLRGQASGNAAQDKDQAVRLQDFEVSEPRNSAETMAPTDSRLDARQPQSVINLQTIQNSQAPTADYATIANLAPSVANVETNGPGLSEAKHTTIRGIDDGGYNVTFDGIPFGDYNTFTHHTTSYFPAKLVGQVVVDRGPGTAATVGNATFGGTMALSSKDPRTEMTFVPTLSYGSYDTKLGHFEVNTGLLSSLGNASAIASYQRMETDGYRSNSDMKRDTYYFKYLQPVGQNTTITLLSSINKISFGNPSTVTQQQIDQFGRDFGLKANTPDNHLDLLNRRYNYQNKKADFEYVGVDTRMYGWRLENKVYTYSYDNRSHEKPKVGSGAAAGQMLGSVKLNEYRTWGDTLEVSHEDTIGIFKAGIWYDRTRNNRYTYGVNYDTTGADTIDLTSTALYKAAAPGGNPATLPGAVAYDFKYLLVDSNITLQPFAEYTWKITNDLTLNAGAKYQEFTRHFNATVNQTSGRQALLADRSDSKTTPSVTAHYYVNRNWSTYAEVAQGFQSPSEGNSFYVDNANLGKISIQPQLSTNYQVGTVFKQNRFNADFAAYYVDFKNYAYNGPADTAGDPIYYGIARGAHYDGVEGQVTYYLGQGVSAYGNGSLNRAEFKGSKLDVPTVPNSTAALGFVFDHAGFFGSFTEKYIGSWTVYDTITNPDIAGAGASRSAKSSSYWLGDLSIGYGHKLSHSFLRSYKVRLQVSNLFDRKVQVLDSIDANAANAYTKDAFNVLPVRAYFLTVATEF